MSKKVINQNSNYDSEFIDSIGSNFIFDENPINRLKNTSYNLKENGVVKKIDKITELRQLKEQINSINDCSLKNNSKNIVLGDGNINSPIMLIGEAPGIERAILNWQRNSNLKSVGIGKNFRSFPWPNTCCYPKLSLNNKNDPESSVSLSCEFAKNSFKCKGGADKCMRAGGWEIVS